MLGKLIAIEGTDGTGKHTQSRLLVDYIENHIGPAKLFSFPRYETETGQLIKLALQSSNISLNDKIRLFAQDRLAAKQEIISHLESGTHVICDRYISSMIVYGIAEMSLVKNEHHHFRREDIIGSIKHLELIINKMPVADLQINLILDPYISKLLMRNRTELDSNETNMELQYKCYQEFLTLPHNNAHDIAKKCINIHCADNDRLFTVTSIHKILINGLIDSNIF